jgi:hypothetical protein
MVAATVSRVTADGVTAAIADRRCWLVRLWDCARAAKTEWLLGASEKMTLSVGPPAAWAPGVMATETVSTAAPATAR